MTVNCDKNIIDDVGRDLMKAANKLVSLYPNKNLQNHCYLRIAYDNVMKEKWDNVISKPFYKNAPLHKSFRARKILDDMLVSEKIVDELNEVSLSFRR